MPSIYVVNVGNGNAAVIHDGENTAIVDAGPGGRLASFLKKKDIRHIKTLVLSHADCDHIGGVMALLGDPTISIETVFVNGDGLKNTEVWADLVTTLCELDKNGHVKLIPCVYREMENKISTGSISLSVLFPTKKFLFRSPGSIIDGHKVTSNSHSVVVSVEFDMCRAILFGDIDALGLDELIKDDKTLLQGWSIVFPHHGGKPGSGDPVRFTKEIIEATNPSNVIFSAAAGRHCFPRPDIINWIDQETNCCICTTNISEHLATCNSRHYNGRGTLELRLETRSINYLED